MILFKNKITIKNSRRCIDIPFINDIGGGEWSILPKFDLHWIRNRNGGKLQLTFKLKWLFLGTNIEIGIFPDEEWLNLNRNYYK